MALTEADVQACLARIVDPNTGRDFVAGKSVRKIGLDGADVAIDLALGYPAKSQHESRRSWCATRSRRFPARDALRSPSD